MRSDDPKRPEVGRPERHIPSIAHRRWGREKLLRDELETSCLPRDLDRLAGFYFGAARGDSTRWVPAVSATKSDGAWRAKPLVLKPVGRAALRPERDVDGAS